MNDHGPIRTARRKVQQFSRLETRTPCCAYCGETAPECLELHHVVGRRLDSAFKEVRCRNCHRKIEFRRDCVGLSKNGIHSSSSPCKEMNGRSDIMRMRLIGLAESHESTAQALRRWAQEVESEESENDQTS
jgi:hypothetical protein